MKTNGEDFDLGFFLAGWSRRRRDFDGLGCLAPFCNFSGEHAHLDCGCLRDVVFEVENNKIPNGVPRKNVPSYTLTYTPSFII
jgi:hypothetical protein